MRPHAPPIASLRSGMSLSAEHAVPLGGSGGPARHLQAVRAYGDCRSSMLNDPCFQGAHMRIRVGDHTYVGMVLGTTEGRTHVRVFLPNKLATNVYLPDVSPTLRGRRRPRYGARRYHVRLFAL